MSPPPLHCVLVVDDEPDVADSVYDLLRREFRVLRARSAQDGLKILQQEPVQIILTDQRMPRVTGVELLEAVHSRHPQAIRLLYTGFADVESIIAAINQGHVYQFIRKPWEPDELVEAVRAAAFEYDRLIAAEEQAGQLQRELLVLAERVAWLEAQIERLGGTLAPSR